MPVFFGNERVNRSGQSIVEVIVALAVISTAVVAALTLTGSSLNAQKSNEDMMVAVNLAREGVEVARNIRDSNWLAERRWDDGLVGESLDYTAIAVFDPVSGDWSLDFAPDSLSGEGTEVWRLTSEHLGIHTQDTVRPADSFRTPFRRLLVLNPVCRSQEVRESGSACDMADPQVGIRIESLVAWGGGKRPRDVAVTETIYDWR
ncbi:hypothetical protein JW899_01650 [Candidatus Uhrbacteria bacterium]|nr:hypothetical protein [Candidatus Uhrbacteria bacterium]